MRKINLIHIQFKEENMETSQANPGWSQAEITSKDGISWETKGYFYPRDIKFLHKLNEIIKEHREWRIKK